MKLKTLTLGTAALLALIAGEIITIDAAEAQVTKSGVKARFRQAGVRGRQKWNSMTPQQQQAAETKGKVDYNTGKADWNSMTPQRQQASQQKAATGGQRLRAKWRTLPQ